MNIVIPFAAVSQLAVPTVGFNNNFTEVATKFNTYAVQTDVAKVINVAHTWAVGQLWAASQTFVGATFTGDLLFTDALYDIGKVGATRPRDGFFSRNLTVGGTLLLPGGIVNLSGFVGTTKVIGGTVGHSVRNSADSADNISTTDAGLVTLRNTLTITAGGMAITGDVLFTDALYDIGKTGATRPRDGFFSRDLTAGGVVNSTGFRVGGNQVVGARVAGWATQTGGGLTRGDMGAGPSLALVGTTLEALINDLRTHGLI